jgi:hypothetical protein
MLKNLLVGSGVLLICLIIVLVIFNKKENFFFEVSKCNPKCSGAFYGKPALFQFSGLDKSCSEKDKSCGEGMICNCKYPECKNIVYGKGMYPTITGV